MRKSRFIIGILLGVVMWAVIGCKEQPGGVQQQEAQQQEQRSTNPVDTLTPSRRASLRASVYLMVDQASKDLSDKEIAEVVDLGIELIPEYFSTDQVKKLAWEADVMSLTPEYREWANTLHLLIEQMESKKKDRQDE